MKSPTENQGLEHSILHLLHRAGQQAEIMFMKEVNDNSMTPRQYAVLFSVDKNEDISQTGLVEQTGIDRSTLADVVRRLVEKGMLQRKRTRNDARKYAVRLTPKGREALESSHPAAIRADQTILASVPAPLRSHFIETLTTIVKAMDELSEAA
jgi:MarR family transcriptional regulator, temperature-dependent positive regulator of motility